MLLMCGHKFSNMNTSNLIIFGNQKEEEKNYENLIALSMSCLDNVSYTNFRLAASWATSICHLFHER